METSIIQQIKKRAGNFIEPQFLKTGRVLDVRAWQPDHIIEIDLHLPAVDMTLWNEVPYIKFRVDNLTFRDYTPAGWDAETCTCTLFINTAHNGPGTTWARSLTKNDSVYYLKIDTTRQKPDHTSLVVGLGDETSIGHLLALQQLTLPVTRFTGAVLMSDAQHPVLFSEYFRSPLHGLLRQEADACQTLFNWVLAQGYCIQHTVFCLTGKHHMVANLRKLLKQQGYSSSQIQVKGFW
ncbi:SIP domain-containing protein [Mucilaginibacter paludis]|uniref:Siderophore-interacting protein-like protein n=1 Tax=Mucilaginibacter paludis DSM 18603 TaxID=714943 RepID=H1Y0T2_9SPHI|nr:siderophore-interacting protein [Mucilaginibacter paludis]EHQ28822.1 siderophore-interacting protein-like protein [Mucilaginibacter paludis DSM 18603]